MNTQSPNSIEHSLGPSGDILQGSKLASMGESLEGSQQEGPNHGIQVMLNNSDLIMSSTIASNQRTSYAEISTAASLEGLTDVNASHYTLSTCTPHHQEDHISSLGLIDNLSTISPNCTSTSPHAIQQSQQHHSNQLLTSPQTLYFNQGTTHLQGGQSLAPVQQASVPAGILSPTSAVPASGKHSSNVVTSITVSGEKRKYDEFTYSSSNLTNTAAIVTNSSNAVSSSSSPNGIGISFTYSLCYKNPIKY